MSKVTVRGLMFISMLQAIVRTTVDTIVTCVVKVVLAIVLVVAVFYASYIVLGINLHGMSFAEANEALVIYATCAGRDYLFTGFEHAATTIKCAAMQL